MKSTAFVLVVVAALALSACGDLPEAPGADEVTATEGALSGWPYCPQKIVQLSLCPNGTSAICYYGGTCGNPPVSCPQQVWGCTGQYQQKVGWWTVTTSVDCVQRCQ